jgi:phage baseplate assembly protein W
MIGLDASTGRKIDGMSHLRQSVRDILTTRIGSRVMRRDYGSNLMALVDAPMNPAWKLDVMAETARALAKWEPRIKVKRVIVGTGTPEGRCTIEIEAILLSNGKPIKLEGIVL